MVSSGWLDTKEDQSNTAKFKYMTMKVSCQGLKIILQCVMIFFLMYYTYERLLKLWEEDTGMSYTIQQGNN